MPHCERPLQTAGVTNPCMQVADALGDSEYPTWIAMLAKRALAINWQDPAPTADMLCALLTLPPALLPRLLASCLSTTPLDTLLSDFPAVLHPPLIATAATSTGLIAPTLNIHAFLSCLPHTQFRYPGLVSLRFPSKPPTLPLTPTTAALLGHAVSAHKCITSLLLEPALMHPAALRSFHSCITPGALPHLISLSLAAAAHPDGCAEVASCLSRLSILTALSVYLVLNEPRAGATPSLESVVRAAAAPAWLEHLPHLKLTERQIQSASLPPGASCSDLLLPLLVAPNLTSLELTTEAAESSIPSLIAAIRHFHKLQTIEIDTDSRDGACIRNTTATGNRAQKKTPIPLRALRTLCITSACNVAPLCIASAIAQHAQHTLTRISVQHVHAGGGRPDLRKVRPEEVKEAWAAFLTALPCCGGLRRLDLPILASMRGFSGGRSWGEEFSGALSHLPHVTQLTLQAACRQCSRGARCVLEGEHVAKVLRSMTELRTFALSGVGGTLDVSAPKRVLAALPELNMLSNLGLCFSGVSRAQIVDVLPQLPALAELQVLAAVLGQTDAEQDELLMSRAGLRVTGLAV